MDKTIYTIMLTCFILFYSYSVTMGSENGNSIAGEISLPQEDYEMLRKVEEYYNPFYRNIEELKQKSTIIETTRYDENGVLVVRDKAYSKDAKKKIKIEAERIKYKSKCIFIHNDGKTWTNCNKVFLRSLVSRRMLMDSFFLLHNLTRAKINNIRKVEVEGTDCLCY